MTKTAIVTGASGGIGKEIAKRLSTDGFNVVVSYGGNAAKAEETVRELKVSGRAGVAVKCDVADKTEVERLFERAKQEFGQIDVLVNSAGIMLLSPIVECDERQFDQVLATNLRGTFLVLANAARHVAVGGRIIALSSSVLAKSFPGYGAYIASKAGVEGLVHVLANELRGRNITVNAVELVTGKRKNKMSPDRSATEVSPANDSLDFVAANVLITGGSEGIGRGLAERFLAVGSTVLVTGRNTEKLKAAANSLPDLLTFVSDISKAEDRAALAAHVKSAMPGLNVLINNAGIQRRVSLAADTAPWPERQVEIDTLLSGPIHLNSLLIPGMLKHGGPGLIVNVTSGGAFIPQAFAPVYSACKAALHSYTVTLRHALKGTAVKVTELIPPTVQTALAGPGATHGAPLNEFCDQVFSALGTGEESIGFGPTNTPQFKQVIEITGPLFLTSSSRFPVATYAASTQKS